MKRIGFAVAAAAAMIAGSLSAPADARRWHHRHHNDGIDGGDVIAGVAVVGGIAAIASAIGSNNRQKQDAAVDTCAEEAEGRANADLSEILHVEKRKGYYTVEGLLGADGAGAPTSFTCTVRNGRIYSMRLSTNEA